MRERENAHACEWGRCGERLRQRETQHERGRVRERETQNPKQAPDSGPSVRTEPDTGLKLTDSEIMT